jgi:N-alpha-acetyltransferase 30
MNEPPKDAIEKAPSKTLPTKIEGHVELRYVAYGSEKESPFLPAIRQLISKDLSEPYSIYVYRYFLYQWGDLCFMVKVPVLTQDCSS